MNRFICGFDDYDATGMLYDWAFAGGGAGSVTIASGISGMTGSCLRCAGSISTGSCGQLYWADGALNVSAMAMGFRYVVTDPPSADAALWGAGDAGGPHLLLALGADMTLAAYKTVATGLTNTMVGATLLGRGTATLVANTAVYIDIEVTIHATEGSVRVFLNGSATPDIDLTNQDTLNAATGMLTWFGLFAPTNTTYAYFDDLYVNDTLGSYNNAREGDVKVHSHYPNAAGNSSQWGRSTGADQYATVDESPQDTSDYNATAALNAKDTLGIENFKNSGATIFAVQVTTLAWAADAGSCAVAPVVRIDSADNVGDAKYLGTSPKYERQQYDTQPDASLWNETDFNAMEVGYVKAA